MPYPVSGTAWAFLVSFHRICFAKLLILQKNFVRYCVANAESIYYEYGENKELRRLGK